MTKWAVYKHGLMNVQGDVNGYGTVETYAFPSEKPHKNPQAGLPASNFRRSRNMKYRTAPSYDSVFSTRHSRLMTCFECSNEQSSLPSTDGMAVAVSAPVPTWAYLTPVELDGRECVASAHRIGRWVDPRACMYTVATTKILVTFGN